MTFNWRQPLTEDDLCQKMTFDGRWPLMEDDLWWKTTFDRRWPLMEDDLWYKTTVFCLYSVSLGDALTTATVWPFFVIQKDTTLKNGDIWLVGIYFLGNSSHIDMHSTGKQAWVIHRETAKYSVKNKPYFCSGSCDEIHATTKLQNKTHWNILETPLTLF